uniref:Thy-1 membrane glycoprotein-like n=1 Tax=Sinocyclocheilus rhinocerous TaxID=307959 RepID=A0A673IA72_9TELE
MSRCLNSTYPIDMFPAFFKVFSFVTYDFSSSVLMIPVLCQDEESVITVCQEEDNDLRVDCLLEPRPNYHTDYEFSMSKGQKEIIINTNISGIMPEPKFRHNTFVTELEPYGFRLTIMSFAISENTTFICKVTKIQKTLFVELDSVEPCSAISVFLLGYPWLNLLVPLCIIQLWEAF